MPRMERDDHRFGRRVAPTALRFDSPARLNGARARPHEGDLDFLPKPGERSMTHVLHLRTSARPPIFARVTRLLRATGLTVCAVCSMGAAASSFADPLVFTPPDPQLAALETCPGPASSRVVVTTSPTDALWSASSDSAWLTVSPAAATGTCTITISAAVSSFAPGTYTGRLVFVAGASTQRLSVLTTVDPYDANITGDRVKWRQRHDLFTHSDDRARLIVRDTNGALLIAGETGDGTNVDACITVCAPDGTMKWTRSYDGPDHLADRPVAVAPDGRGGAFLCVASQTLTQDLDVVLCRYDPDGNAQPPLRYDGSVHQSDHPTGMGTDASGQAFILAKSVETGARTDLVVLVATGTGAWLRVTNMVGTCDPGEVPATYPIGLMAVTPDGCILASRANRKHSHYTETLDLKIGPQGAVLWEHPGEGSVVPGPDGTLYYYGRSRVTRWNAEHTLRLWDRQISEGQIFIYFSPARLLVAPDGACFLTGTYFWNKPWYTVVKIDPQGTQAWYWVHYGSIFSGGEWLYESALDAQTNLYLMGSGGTVLLAPTGEELGVLTARPGEFGQALQDAEGGVILAGSTSDGPSRGDIDLIRYWGPHLDDADSDRLPNAWEATHFTNAYAGRPWEDVDLDGYDNLAEWVLDTVPTAVTSRFSLGVAADAMNRLALSFQPRSTSRLYAVEACSDPAAGLWSPLTGSLTNDTADLRTVVDRQEHTSRLYRVRVQVP